MKPDRDKPAQFKQRKAARTPVSTSARLRPRSSYDVEVRLCDVSTGGFMAECPDSVPIGSYVSLDVPGVGPVNAQVRWQLGARMGGKFLDPISLARCEWPAVRPAEAEEPAEA